MRSGNLTPAITDELSTLMITEMLEASPVDRVVRLPSSRVMKHSASLDTAFGQSNARINRAARIHATYIAGSTMTDMLAPLRLNELLDAAVVINPR